MTNSANTSIGGIAGSIEDGTTLNECLNFITINSINKMYGSSTGTTNVNSCYYDSQHCINGSDNGSTGKTTAEMKGTGLTLTSSQWSTDAGRYPIPINIASHEAAIVAAAPVTLAGSENCQTVASDFTVYTTTGLEWTTEDGTDNITIDGSSVTIDEPFSLITLTASIDGWEKKVPLENSTFVTELTIDSIQDLENLRVAVSQGDAGRYKDVANVEGFARASFRMTTDLAITGNWTGIGTSSNPFRGTFDGGGHTISGMRASSGAARGLFGYIVNATITNLNVTTGSRQIVATTPSGGIVAKATSSTISNCSFNGNIKATGNYAGGIVGQMVSSTIENCVTSGTIISSGSYVGGICGRTEITSGESHITNCVSIANIDGLSSVGGIAGYSSNSTISNCLFAGNITGSSENVGGICGYNTDNAVVEYCLNGGTVNIMGGGVIGYQHPEATTRGNFFDKQRTDLNGIAHIGEGGPSDENATGKKTTEIIGTGHGLFASGWTETAGLYPVPSAISTKDATKLASVPAVLATDEVYNNVSSDFTLGTITGLTWTVTTSDYDEDGTPYVRIDGLNARVDSDETNIAELKATYNGLTKTINVFKSSDADILTIDNPQQLKDFRDAVNNGTTGIYKGVPNINGFAGKTFILNCSPTLDAAWTPIGTADKSFSGIFDGNNNTISGLSVSGNADNKGLFGYVVNGEILNLNVTGTVAGKNNVGGICGYINGSNSSNYARIINCTFNGTASASVSYAGGIAGRNENYSSISKCMVAGSVSAVTSYAGGISGYSHSTTTSALDSISSCTNAAEVSSAKYSGGIVGRNYYSRIEYCNNGGNVSGLDYTTGGITGNNYSSSQVAYNISTAMVNNGGAVIGYNQGTSSYNYYDKQRSSVKGHSATSGISSDASAKAVGLYTINMTGETPSGLDGDNWRALYWTFTEGLYPIPAALGENDFTIATSTPIFLANNEPWDNVTHDFVLGVPSTTTWVSSDALFVNVSAAPNAVVDNYDTNGDDIIDDNDNHSTILTSTLGTVSKNYTIIDYGENTPELIIRNIDDLKDFRDAVNAGSDGSYNGIINVGGYLGYNIILDADIDLSGEENWEPIGNNLGCCFAGNFIGNSHTISNLKITATESYAGLFGYVKKGGISGITLTDVNISNSTSYTGAICGYIIGDNTAHSDISDCTVSGQLKSTTSNSYLGGIVGAAGSYSGIYNCINEANLIGRNYTGGICGSVSAGNINDDIISDCENSGTITANSASYHYIGGIVGYIQTAGLIVYCRNIGDIKGGYEIGGISGYLVGSNDYGRKGTISECWNNGKIESISTTKGYAGGLVGRMTTFVKIEKGVNSGNVIGKHSNIGGVTGTSTATRDDKENLITKCTNSAVVSSPTANFVAGICGMDSLTTISYCNNGGNVVGSDPIYVGGITGHNNNSTLTYNISTGSVEPASTTNGIYGTNTGVVTENYYDSQRSKWESSDEGKTTLELTGETPSALTDAAWAENFVLTENMYPMPTDLESEPEVQLAATPIFLNSSPIENYDSVISSFTVGAADSWDSSWEGEETDVVVILDAAVTVNNKCETIPVTLTAELSGYTKEYSITVSKKMPELPASPENPSFVWYGRETDWNTPGNWMFYDGSYETATLVPETEDDNVIITEMECMEIPQITANTTLHNLTIGENMGLNIASENLLTITGATTINSPIVGNVQFNAGSTCDGSSYIEGTITKIGHSRFKFLTGNADLQSAFEMTPVSDATVTVHYDTVRSEMPDWWSHGGNMNGGLNHVSDREYWYVQSTANLEDVTLYWVGNGNHGISSDELGNLRDYLTVAYTDGSNWMNAGASFPVDYESEISLEYGYVTASNVIPFGTRSGKYITEGSTDGEKLVLPIELVSFTASCNGNSVEVEWTTASENNNDYFILEKSYDAVNFSEIARIEGIGNSIVENRYSYTDNENYGGEMYYRLQQVDYDGIRTVSEIIVAKCTDYELEPTVAVFPNPFRSKVTLSLENFGNKPATIEVFNVMGTLVRTIDINATGNNYETVLNLEELSAATYTIRISTADFVVNKRVVKQ